MTTCPLKHVRGDLAHFRFVRLEVRLEQDRRLRSFALNQQTENLGVLVSGPGDALGFIEVEAADDADFPGEIMLDSGIFHI